jgi:purine-binding chemotaxis protein CheW
MTAAIRSARRREIDWDSARRRLAATMNADPTDDTRSKATLDARARELARPLLSTKALSTQLELVSFVLAGERYAIETRHVSQVLKLRDLIRLPGAPEHWLGLTNLSGEVLAVFDLRVLLELPRTHLGDMSRLFVLGNGSPELGLLADRVDEISWLDPAEVLPPAESLSALARVFVRGVTRHAVVVLDGHVLLHDPRLFLGGGDQH